MRNDSLAGLRAPSVFIHSGAPEREGRKLSRKLVYKVNGTSEINLFKLIVVFDFPYCPRPETTCAPGEDPELSRTKVKLIGLWYSDRERVITFLVLFECSSVY